MAYTYRKKLFGGKLVDEKGQELEFNKKELKVKAFGDGFVFDTKEGGRTQELRSVEMFGGRRYRGEGFDKTGCLVDVATGKFTEPFIDYNGGFIATLGGRLKTVDNELNVKDTGYLAITKPSRYANHDVLPYIDDRGLEDEAMIAKTADGKFGVVTAKGVICPFVYDSDEIEIEKVFSAKNGHKMISFTCKGRELLVDETGKTHDSIYRDQGQEQFSVYDKKNNKSTIYKHNRLNGKLEQVAVLDGKATYAFESVNGDIVYQSKVDDKWGIVDKDGKEVVKHQYDSISLTRMSVKDDVLLCVGHETGGRDIHGRNATKKGIYSLAKGKEIVAPEYDNFDFNQSGIGENGLVKFFAQRDRYWGVVNEKNKVEVDFEYRHTPSITTTTYRRKKRDDGSYDYHSRMISELEIEDKDGNTRYFNIGQKNIIATEEEMEDIEAYHKGLRESVARDRAEKEERIAREKADKEKRAADNRRAEREERSTAAAIGATILTGSPIAGMIVKGLMDDDGMGMD